MAERDICRELFEAQQQTITSFVKSVERDISAKSELAKSLLEQTSGVASRSLQEQVEGLIAKEKQNASIRSPQVETVPVSKTSKDQEIEAHATRQRDKVFNIVPGTVNVT